MSDIFPTSQIAGARIQPIYQVAFSESLSGKLRQRDLGGSYFQISLDLNGMNIQRARVVQGFLARYIGSSFKLKHPLISNNSAKYTGTMIVDGANQTGDTVQVDSLPANTLVLKSGDYIRFSNHLKVYMVTEDIVSNGSGIAELKISPNLIDTIADDEPVLINDVDWTVATLGNVNGLDLTNRFPAGILGNNTVSIELREAF